VRSATRRILAATLSAALAGCGTLGSDEPQRYYVLDPGPAKPAAGNPRATALLIAPTTAPSFYETQEVVFSRAPSERGYYQFHAWTERPGRRLTELLVQRLERSGLFKTVASAVSGVQGSLVLNTHLAEFYHDAAKTPGSVRVTITAELMDPARRVLLARRTFERSAPAATYDAPGAVRAFGTAVAAILDDIAQWVDASAPPM
jgi:cholesterol transport system auxiliary component